MKIVYIVEDFAENGGVERIVSLKANELSTKYGHDVTIVSVYKDERPVLYSLDKSIGFVRLDVPFATKSHRRIATLASRLATLARAASRLNKAVKRLDPDIIFFTTTLGALLLPFCRTKAKRVYESHLARPFNPYQQLFWLTKRSADAVICLTKGDMHAFGDGKNVRLIPNFIEQPKRSVADYGRKKAIAVGRLENQKGFDMLIDCWKRVAEQHPDWHLDIYGVGSLHDKLQEQIDQLHLNDYITLCGRSNNIMDVYPEYSLHIMSSRYEGQPMTLIEAQACGLPSVVFNFKFGAADIVQNGVNGIIVEQDDCKALSEALCKMMSSEDMRKKYGQNAFEVGKQYFKNNVFSKWIELLEFISKA
ncbi:glycosyltransferase family 4 protein [Leyella stercorea]|uniref:glycosyltransferase family 4 protein n=1 Tax=Leyella stercorea TaxID=363265 RepID=UPI003A94444D